MKSLVVVAWLGLAALAVSASTLSCTTNNRSEGYACTQPSDCSAGRTCVDNFCVLTGAPLDGQAGGDGGRLDAAPGGDAARDAGPVADAARPDAAACPPGCTSCDPGSNTCDVVCSGQNSCMNERCPAGWNCNYTCTGQGSCRAIDCQAASSCTVQCVGDFSCRDVQGGNGSMTATCAGDGACRTLDCVDACKCDVSCSGQGSCQSNGMPTLTCPTGGACSLGMLGGMRGCTSAPPGCATTCP